MSSTVAVGRTNSLLPLARIQARRFALHPLFIVCAVLGASGVLEQLAGGREQWQPQDLTLAVGLWIGVPAIIVAYRLAISENSAESMLDGTPAPAVTRTLALCLAGLVPAAVGLILLVPTITATVLWQPPPEVVAASAGEAAQGSLALPAYLAAIGWGGALAHWFDCFVVAPFGGAALGVAAARWLRIPGGAAITAVGVSLIALFVGAAAEEVPGVGESWIVRVAAAASPFVLWESGTQGLVDGIRPGSPTGHLLYAICLSGLAVWAAVMRDAEGRDRAAWTRVGWALGGSACVTFLWALLG